MGTEHGKDKKNKKAVTVRIPLRRPKSLEQSSKTTVSDKQKRRQISKSSSTMSDEQKKRKTSKSSPTMSGESSNKTTITDTQKRGQVFPRYNLFEGRRLPKVPTKKNDFTKDVQETMKKKPGRPTQKGNTQPTQPKEFLPHIMKPLYVFPDGEKPKFLRKKTSGEA